MKKVLTAIYISVILADFWVIPVSAVAQSTATSSGTVSSDFTVPALTIDSNGNAAVKGMKVWQRAGTSLFARTTWDQSFIRWTVKTNGDTEIKKRFGDKMSVDNIAVGDYLSVEGFIEGGNSLAIVATKITDWSNYQAMSSFSGKISSMGESTDSFVLSSDSYGDISVMLASSTIIIRNRREISPKYLAVGDKVTSIVGTYDHQSKVMRADKINVYINPSIFAPQNYQGTLIKMSGSTLPATLIVNVGGKYYNVALDQNTLVLSSQRKTTTLDRFLLNDTVRLYAYIRQDNDELDTLTASIIRDLNF